MPVFWPLVGPFSPAAFAGFLASTDPWNSGSPSLRVSSQHSLTRQGSHGVHVCFISIWGLSQWVDLHNLRIGFFMDLLRSGPLGVSSPRRTQTSSGRWRNQALAAWLNRNRGRCPSTFMNHEVVYTISWGSLPKPGGCALCGWGFRTLKCIFLSKGRIMIKEDGACERKRTGNSPQVMGNTGCRADAPEGERGHVQRCSFSC